MIPKNSCWVIDRKSAKHGREIPSVQDSNPENIQLLPVWTASAKIRRRLRRVASARVYSGFKRRVQLGLVLSVNIKLARRNVN